MTPLLLSFAIAFLISPLIIKIYTLKKWVDDPKKEPHAKKTHITPVPRGGGIVVFMAILISSLIFLQIDKYLMAIFIGGLILTITGFADDVLDIHPKLRIITGLIASLIVIGSGIGIAYISNPFGEGVIHLNHPQIVFNLFNQERAIWVFSSILALFFLMWNMNIINWSKGVDGQLPGFVAIASIIIGLLSLRFADDPTQFNVSHLSFIVAGAYFGLLIWNWYPQKIMPGYGAGSLAGFFLSILAILSGAKVATLFMVLAIPTADGIFTILRRIIAGKSPFWGDRGHLHHKLMDVYGWDKRAVAVFYWLSSLVMGAISLFLDTKMKIIAMILTVGLVFTLLIMAKIKKNN